MMIAGSKSFKRNRFHHSQTVRDYEKIQKRIQENEGKLQFISEFLDHFFGTHVNTLILNSLAKIIMDKHGLSLDRLAKRNRSALLCWYAENWDKIQPVLKTLNIGRTSENICQVDVVQSITEAHSSPINQSSCPDPYSLSILLNRH